MQDRWENREYVVEKWTYPNIPVYVVHPRDGEGCSWTLYRNYLLPINSNMGQGKADEPEERVKNNTIFNPSTICRPAFHKTVQINLLLLDAWHSEPPGTNLSLEVSKFWVVNRYQANWHLGCMGWPVCLFTHSSLVVHHFLGRCSVEHTLLIAKYAHWDTTHSSIQGKSLDM